MYKYKGLNVVPLPVLLDIWHESIRKMDVSKDYGFYRETSDALMTAIQLICMGAD